MIGFPFDSHVSYDEDGNPIFDRAISSEPFRNLLKELFKTGIMPTVSTNLQVIAGEGMTVTVKAGFAMVEGCMKLEENDRVLSVQASSSLDRIDTVVLRLNNNDNARYCDLYIVEGTPASAPVRPALTRNGSIYELGLADLFIAKNTSVIQDYRITDTRYEAERCGVISSISEFDTESLNRQIQDWTQEQQAEFTAWVETIKNILDEATAGHLQNEIDSIRQALENVPTFGETSEPADVIPRDADTLGGRYTARDIDAINTHLSVNRITIGSNGSTQILRNDSYIQNGVAHFHFQLQLPISIAVGGAIFDSGVQFTRQTIFNMSLLNGGGNYCAYQSGNGSTMTNANDVTMPSGYYIVDGIYII